MLAVSPDGDDKERNRLGAARYNQKRARAGRVGGLAAAAQRAADIKARQSLPARPAVDWPSQNPADGHTSKFALLGCLALYCETSHYSHGGRE